MAVDEALGEDEPATGVSPPSSQATAVSKLSADLRLHLRLLCLHCKEFWPPCFLQCVKTLEDFSQSQNSIHGGPSNCDPFILVTCHSVWKYAIQFVSH